MFKSAELPWLITFFQMFYNDKPVDWLLEHLIYTKMCNWEKDMVSKRTSHFLYFGSTQYLKWNSKMKIYLHLFFHINVNVIDSQTTKVHPGE